MTKTARERYNQLTPGIVSKYVHNRSMHLKTMQRIKPDGTHCYVVDGKEISPKEFNAMYPIDCILGRSKHGTYIDPRSALVYL